MTVMHVVRPRSSDSGETSYQHFYFIAALVVVITFVILRLIVLRRRNQALSNFFRMGGNSQYSYGSYPPHGTSLGSIYHGIQLAPVPAAYHPDRRVRAADVDALGRRLGAGEESAGKDALPAYNNLDRPPKYVEAGWSGAPPPLAEQSATIPPTEGEQSGMADQTTTNGGSGNNISQPPHGTHTVAGGNDPPPPPPTYNHLSNS